MRSWCRFLCRQGTADDQPGRRPARPAPGQEAAALPAARTTCCGCWTAPPADTPLGLRDRAILETLYSAGLRVSELTGLNLDDLDLDDGLATVRGKGKRERLALLGPPAADGAEGLAGRARSACWRAGQAQPTPCSSTRTAPG